FSPVSHPSRLCRAAEVTTASLPSNPRTVGSLPTETPLPPNVSHRPVILPWPCSCRKATPGSRQEKREKGCSPSSAPRAWFPESFVGCFSTWAYGCHPVAALATRQKADTSRLPPRESSATHAVASPGNPAAADTETSRGTASMEQRSEERRVGKEYRYMWAR